MSVLDSWVVFKSLQYCFYKFTISQNSTVKVYNA